MNIFDLNTNTSAKVGLGGSFTSLSQNAPSVSLGMNATTREVSPEGDTIASKNARFRTRNAPGVSPRDSSADVFTTFVNSLSKN